jgi:hypothetical protein
MILVIRTVAIAFVFLGFAPFLEAELRNQERKAMKEMTAGDLYLRNNVPCRYTSGWGIGAEPVTEVSPSGVDWEKNLALIAQQKQKRGLDTIYWGFGPNDIIRYGKLYFKGETVELWAEGVKPKDTEIWIRFVQIKSLDDFQKAFDHILSTKPLQDEHPDWPEEVRKAIAGRKVVEGMTKAQAFVVVGTPIAVETGENQGKQIETWFPRQENGASADLRKVVSTETGFPTSLRFVDGILVTVGQIAKPVRVDLKK